MLRTRFGARLIQGTAEVVLSIVDRIRSTINETGARQPQTLQTLIRETKSSLAGTTALYGAHDLLRQHLDELRSVEALQIQDMSPNNASEEYERRLTELVEALKVPCALVAACSYWGAAQTDKWWLPEIEDFTKRRPLSGHTDLINLRFLPATALVYAAGAAAVAADRLDLAAQLIVQLRTQDPHANAGTRGRLAHIWAPFKVLMHGNASRILQDLVTPLLRDALSLGARATDNAWERFEYLRVVEDTHENLTQRKRLPQLDSARQRASSLNVPAPAPGAVQAYQQLLEAECSVVGVRQFQIRVRGQYPGYITSASQWFNDEIDRRGDSSLLIRYGMCGRNPPAALCVADLIDFAVSEFGAHQACQVMPRGGGQVPDGPFWLTEPRVEPLPD